MNKELVSMTDFVGDILSYTHESGEYKRSIQILEWCYDLLHEPLSIEMFGGDNPLFLDFEVAKNLDELYSSRDEQTIFQNNNGAFNIKLHRKSEYSSTSSGKCFITSFNLHTVEDLCGRGIKFNTQSEWAETDLFNNI